MALSLASMPPIPCSTPLSNSVLQLNCFNARIGGHSTVAVVTKCELKDSSGEKRLSTEGSRLQIGSPIIVIEAPKMLKTAASVPCLRPNSGLVKPGDVGRPKKIPTGSFNTTETAFHRIAKLGYLFDLHFHFHFVTLQSHSKTTQKPEPFLVCTPTRYLLFTPSFWKLFLFLHLFFSHFFFSFLRFFFPISISHFFPINTKNPISEFRHNVFLRLNK
ncbi:hypothetical protein F0562_022412 [Nyssa sinensis]|uniref:Uncharacterized protein n=1 Tax=Nyssa sinensis TaxID=561372 RepID=A0A5J5BQK4_9ASTE|nr:hypothetical protein F0562_022412 [Nyssa sinensis]